MKDLKIYIFALVFIVFVLLNVITFCIFLSLCSSRPAHVYEKNPVVKSQTSASGTPAASTSPCTITRAPDGRMVPVCPPEIVLDGDGVPAPSTLGQLLSGTSTLLSAGTGTTTLRAMTPYNDILIAESSSTYAQLRNVRYSMWPYPGELRFKEIYLVLPDVYEPIFPGYSNNQFVVSSEGTKHVMLYLRHQANTGVGDDTQVLIQSPVVTDEPDHPMELIDSSSGGAILSTVVNGEEVIVEVVYVTSPGLSHDAAVVAHKELLQALMHMEVVW